MGDRWSPWSGRVSTLSRLAESCWERPTQPTASRAPSGETSVSRSDVTSVTEVTRSSRPRRKSPCGSRRTNWSTGTPVRRPGYTSRVTAVYVFLHQNEDYKNKNYLMKINRFTFGKKKFFPQKKKKKKKKKK